jgi:hypothetical protein
MLKLPLKNIYKLLTSIRGTVTQILGQPTHDDFLSTLPFPFIVCVVKDNEALEDDYYHIHLIDTFRITQVGEVFNRHIDFKKSIARPRTPYLLKYVNPIKLEYYSNYKVAKPSDELTIENINTFLSLMNDTPSLVDTKEIYYSKRPQVKGTIELSSIINIYFFKGENKKNIYEQWIIDYVTKLELLARVLDSLRVQYSYTSEEKSIKYYVKSLVHLVASIGKDINNMMDKYPRD